MTQAVVTERGALIVGFHNMWSGISVVLTLLGWGLLIKGLIHFCAPKQGLRMMARVSVERSWGSRFTPDSITPDLTPVSESPRCRIKERFADERHHAGSRERFADAIQYAVVPLRFLLAFRILLVAPGCVAIRRAYDSVATPFGRSGTPT